MKTAGIILAGGASSRMGSPKALLTYQDETFVERLVRIFQPLCPEVIVVAGLHTIDDRKQLDRARLVVNHSWEQGQLSSLQCALKSLSSEPDVVLLTLVDCPAIQPETPAALLAAWQLGVSLVRPRFEGRHGHPIVFSSSLIPEFLSLHPDCSAREVVHRHAEQTRFVDVADPGILRDIDCPSDYQALVGARVAI